MLLIFINYCICESGKTSLQIIRKQEARITGCSLKKKQKKLRNTSFKPLKKPKKDDNTNPYILIKR